MDTGILIVLVVLGLGLVAAVVVASRQRSARRDEGLRTEAREHREEAAIRTSRADAQEAEAEERAARAKREQARAEEQAALAGQERRAAQERQEHADQIDPDRIDPDADDDAVDGRNGHAERTDPKARERLAAGRGSDRTRDERG